MIEWNGIVLTLAQETDRPGGGEGAGNQTGGAGGNGGGNQTEGADGGRDGGGQGQGDGAGGAGGFGGLGLPFLLLIFLVVMVGMTIFSQRREKKKRQALIESIGKNDRVVTIGGIIGTVVEIKENEVVLKVDESSNTRMRFSKSAIQGVVGQES